MIRVMDMSTGKIVEDEFGAFENEVLNAEWMPPAHPEVAVGLQEARTERRASNIDADVFLATVYRHQR